MTLRILVMLIVIAYSLLLNINVPGQSGDRKFEVGAQFSFMRLTDFDPNNELTRQAGIVPLSQNFNEPGFGARVGYNFTNQIAVEAEGNLFLKNRSNGDAGHGKEEVLFGPKIGTRHEKWGVFGKARPGLIRFAGFPRIIERRLLPCSPQPCQLTLIVEDSNSSKNFFALDVGGVAELYPSRRSLIRFDLGDTIIRYTGISPRELNPQFTRHNLQFSAGFGFRF